VDRGKRYLYAEYLDIQSEGAKVEKSKYRGNKHMITDTTFFSNEPGYTLLDRFKKTLKRVKYFDVLVGLNDDKIKAF